MPHELIDHCLRAVPIDEVMVNLERLTAYDRYQASLGIEQAAVFVAETARKVGLVDVTIERFPADGTRRWWSFRAPVAWTPTIARLGVRARNGSTLEIDHARQPFSIATYSAATPEGGVRARLLSLGASGVDASFTGAIAVIDRATFQRRDPLPELSAHGALGFVTDATARNEPTGEQPGRLELMPNATLFGFSVTSSQLASIKACAAEGASAHVIVRLDQSAWMPVVTGVIPGEQADGEVWLTSHLCHPRPGANDNASGCAALLGVAAAHVRSKQADKTWRSRRGIRFAWGPEFLGVAAMLHQRMNAFGEAGLPSAVVNLDMVGEDQRACECPFLVERNPDFRPSLITPLAEYVVSRVFARTNQAYGSWRSVPFMGFSDHALFAAQDIRRPAVQFCHVPDRFNHSAADSFDKVSPLEMQRSTAAGAALARILAHDALLSQAETAKIVREWCISEDLGVQKAAERYQQVNGGLWMKQFQLSARRSMRAMLALIDDTVVIPEPEPEPGQQGPTTPVIAQRWSGPFNARGMMEDVSTETRATLTELARTDKMTLALLLQFAIRADGATSRRQIMDRTSFSIRRPIAEDVGEKLFDALVESRWVEEMAPSKS